MTQYLPHSSKKLSILQRRESALFKLIDEKAPFEKIVKAAERVRDSRVRAIEAIISSDGPRSQPSIHDKHIELVRNLSIESILAYFGYLAQSNANDQPASVMADFD